MKLQVQKLAYGYPGRRIGSDVSLELNAGEVLCLLGPNGSGKTTLFRTLLGLLPVQDGTVMLDDRDLHRLERDELARLVSYVPQAQGAFFPYTVREVVLMGRTAHFGLFAAPSARDRGAAQDAIRRTGNQRKLALAPGNTRINCVRQMIDAHTADRILRRPAVARRRRRK